MDVWDPDRALKELQAVVHGLEAASTPTRLVVIDSLQSGGLQSSCCAPRMPRMHVRPLVPLARTAVLPC